MIHDEVKRRVRREHWPVVWLLPPLSGALLWWQIEWFGGFGGRGFGPRPDVASATLILTSIIMFFSAMRLGSSFDRDRANGTLVFLFLTPLTETEIAVGKLAAGLIFSFGLLLGALPFLVLTTLLQWLNGDFLTPFYWLLWLIFIFGELAYFSVVNLLCAVLSRRATQGTSNAFIVGVFSQFVLLSLPFIVAFLVDKFITNLPDYDPGTNFLACWLWLANLALTFSGWRFYD